jgi:hypothetical protein
MDLIRNLTIGFIVLITCARYVDSHLHGCFSSGILLLMGIGYYVCRQFDP